MRITLFGTAAAEGFPAMFCECPTCVRARNEGGKSLRTRSDALIDDSLLIDLGPDLLTHTLYSGLSLIKVTDVLITHSHEDHLFPYNIAYRTEVCSKIKDKKPMNIYCTKASFDSLCNIKNICGIDESIVKINEIKPFETFFAGRYKITPLKANHSKNTNPIIYLINDRDKTFFYSTDTGVFPDETWKYLEKNNIYIDAMAIDCTAMLLKNWREGHLGLDTDVEVVNRLKKIKVADEFTKIIVHHFSHNGGATHSEMVEISKQYGYDVAFDGMKIEI